MRRDPEFFGEQELDLLYIGKKLKHALAVEALLEGARIDYAVETETYVGGMIFRTERVGAFLYVLPGDLERARETIRAAGFEPA
jgi:hypothetical protein